MTDTRLTKEQRDRIEIAAKGGGYYGPLSSEDLRTLLADYDARGEALERAANRFRFYEAEHAKKQTPEGDAKAQTNADMAELCERALAASPPPPVQTGEADEGAEDV